MTYFVTDAPLYNPIGWLDPWYYTGFWTNFEQMYLHFANTYYASRLPWIVPGYLLNLEFGQRSSYFILHIVFFLTGGLLFYALCRRWLGITAALAAYVGLIGSQMYFNAHRYDYEPGGALTFVIASIAFALPRHASPRLRAASLALSGFFGAAAVTTLIVDSVYLVLGLPFLYWAVSLGRGFRRSLRQFMLDAAAFAVGALLLLAAGGIFAVRHSANFWFFMPQIRAVFLINGADYQQPFQAWLPYTPHFFLPIFVVVLGLAVLIVDRPTSPLTRRLLIAGIGWTAIVFAGFASWEFLGTGYLLESPTYFNVFLVPILFTLAALVASMTERLAGSRMNQGAITVTVAAAVVVPEVWIYRSDGSDRVANGISHGAYRAMLVGMVVAIVLVVLNRIVPRLVLAVLVPLLAFFAVSYGADASRGTWNEGRSDPRTGALYELGGRLTSFLQKNGFKYDLPYFWLNSGYDGGAYASLQSLYLYSYTFVGLNLPRIDDDFRARISLYQPTKLVLLCSTPRCSNAPLALKRAGYATKLARKHVFGDAPFRVWIEIYRLGNTRASQ